MTFNPQQLTMQLNENSAFRDQFAQDPQGALNQMGLAVSDEIASMLAKQMMEQKTFVDHTVLGVTRM